MSRQRAATNTPQQYAQQGAPGSGAPYQGGATQTGTASDPWAAGVAGFGTTFGGTPATTGDEDDF